MNTGGIGRRIGQGEAVVAGVLSGTSADGIDVALARFEGEGTRLRLAETLAGRTLPFPGELAGRVRRVLDGAAATPASLALLHRDLGVAFGKAVARVAEEEGLTVDLVGSHGQTVYHHDDMEPSGPATLQLGDGCHVAEAVGADTVSDFRQADIAAGGGGAPLSAYGDEVLFSTRPLAILNLGGMANWTVLRAEDPPLAFDSGPAGALLDGLARRHLGSKFDPAGKAASSGRPDSRKIEQALAHPFFSMDPPKSTGRDTFGEAWIEELGWEGSPEDLCATGVEVVARTAAESLRGLLPGEARVAVAGGGIHNQALLGALERHLCLELVSTAEFGVDPDLREALMFAALAARAACGVPSTTQATTGAAPGRILGKWSPRIR